MNENKLKNFLVNGFQALDDKREGEETEDISGETEEVFDDGEMEIEPQVQTESDDMKEIRNELLKIRYILEDLKDDSGKAAELPDMGAYLTTREQMKSLTASIERRDSDSANKNLVNAMEQIAIMREDFFRLCKGMRERIDVLSAEDVLSSFEAYEVDMENILSDGGVYIGPFEFDKLNTLHQRIIGVVPTDDKEKNGMIAERVTDGYKLGSKVLLKEKVSIYKYTDTPEAKETTSETVCDKESDKEEEE